MATACMLVPCVPSGTVSPHCASDTPVALALSMVQPCAFYSFPPEADRAPAAQVWTRLDTVTGEAQMWSPGARCFCEELMFQPGAAGAEVEDDGFLLGMYFDAEQQRSCLVVRRRCA